MPQCPFCDARHRTKRTKGEHVIPKWMAKLFPDTTWKITNELTNYTATNIRYINVKTPQVCSPCNNGWMSDLERLAQPVLIPLIHGEAKTLSPLDQQILGSWFCLRAMAYDLHCETFTPRPKYFEDSEYKRMMNTLTFEPYYSIYIGGYTPFKGHTGCALEDHLFVGLPHDPTQTPVRAYSFTLAFERLVLQIFCVKSTRGFWYQMPDLSDYCTQLGVDSVVSYPTRRPFRKRIIKQFADRWSLYLERNAP